MHKFTIFTILLSVIVVLVVADVVVGDFLGKDFAEETSTESSEEVAIASEDWDATELTDPESRGDEEAISEESVETPIEETEVLPTEETTEIPMEEIPEADAQLTTELLTTAGFTSPSLSTEPYDGLIFGFWDTTDAFAENTVFRHKLFSGADYVATFYEIQTDSEVALFEAYETLRTLANTSTNGEINENNTYGDASFYFNHLTKTNTVFLVFQKSGMLYAFEYPPTLHAQTRGLIDLL